MKSYVVVDLEMCRVLNQEKKKTFGHESELIQIGAVLLNSSFGQVDSFSTFVHPEFGAIDKSIKKLTGITGEDVKDAPTAEEAIRAFVEWLPEDAVIVSWSMTDKDQIKREIRGKKIEIPEIFEYYPTWTDCQDAFSKKIHDKRKYNLKYALDICGIDYIDKQHDALADAVNTAKLFKKIMESEGEMELSPYYIPADYASSVIFDPFALRFSHARAS